MERWAWLIGYVALFALLHLVLYYLYRKRDDEERQPPLVGDHGASGNHMPFDGAGSPWEDPNAACNFEPAGETVRCPHCGAKNDADGVYTYCWNCLSPMG